MIPDSQNHNSSTKQRATTDQNPYIYIKQCEMNNCFDRKQQNKNNDAYKKNWKKHSWNQADVVQKLTKVLQKTLKQQGNYFDRNNNKFNNNQGKLFNSLNEYRYDDVKSKRNDDSFMYVKIQRGQTNLSKQNKGTKRSETKQYITVQNLCTVVYYQTEQQHSIRARIGPFLTNLESWLIIQTTAAPDKNGPGYAEI
ncbi:Hypothetical_protein [Hexamita inflata]|uniref:Hypothetical_protein n=1 Tax=Hexamita inflata TaxID=28002 RepID=A0AA86NK05_9EUKA|nr:Hypothetical protein HINF_LOCUS8860 [Hexamita inflata]